MRKVIFTLLVALLFNTTFAGENDPRLILDPALAPFYHGVASGDPLQDGVIIWTRVSTTASSVNVEWEMSVDTSFAASNIVANGSVTTDATKDCTVKIDVTGLQSNTYYYYRFKADGKYSMIGRTKTAPVGADTDQLRFATVSCSNFQHGYFNVYNRIKDRNDIDVVLHLGDYVYEYGPGEYGDIRDHLPEKEMVELVDYRTRYSLYRLDPAVRDLHQQYPFIVTWDDHETADNSYRDGAENHTPGAEGNWVDRLSYAAKAYSEWLPIRNPDPSNDEKIFRKFSYGDLADIFVLDTRIIGRDLQLEFFDQIEDPEVLNDTARHLLGAEQLAWLQDGLLNSTGQWKVIVQQVMVAPLTVFDLIVNTDQWDGYPAERSRLFDFISGNNIDNVVVLTGDIHTSWAMDLPLGPNTYDPMTGANSVGVEFVTTSVTSPGVPFNSPVPFIKQQNKHIKHVNLSDHGFGLLDLTSTKAQNDIYFIGPVEELNDRVRYGTGFFTNDGDNHLTRAAMATESIYPLATPAPDPFDTMSVDTTVTAINPIQVEIIGLYPNPVVNQYVSLQFFVQEAGNVSLQLFDAKGSLLVENDLGMLPYGLHADVFELPNISPGSYNLAIRHGNNIISQTLIKLE